MADQTPREEFEQQFGQITDDQWQWLKEFTERNRPDSVLNWDRVLGFRFNGRIHHPSEVELILNDPPPRLSNAERLERIRAINEERKVITQAEIIEISVDPRPNAFGYGIDHAKLFIEPEMRRTDGEG